MTPNDDLTTAQTILTQKEYAAYQLHYRRYSERHIALTLHISRSAVQSRLENAHRKINDATGNP